MKLDQFGGHEAIKGNYSCYLLYLLEYHLQKSAAEIEAFP